MKKLILSIALVGASFSAHANNWNMPWNNNNGFNNGSSWNMPNFNWGNNRSGFNNGSSWSMPSFNWGNNNGYGSGSNWSMPNFNWGNGFNNGYNNGSNWGMPFFNGNQPWSNGGNRYYNNGYVPSYSYAPRVPNRQYPNQQYKAPQRPIAPQYAPRLQQQKPMQQPVQKPMQRPAPKAMPKQRMTMPHQTKVAPAMPKKPAAAHIPMPNEVKGVILAPENKPVKAEVPKK